MDSDTAALNFFLVAAKNCKVNNDVIKNIYNEMINLFAVYSEDEIKKQGLEVLGQLFQKEYNSVFSDFINEKLREAELSHTRRIYEKALKSESKEELDKVLKILQKYYPIEESELLQIYRKSEKNE